MARTIHQSKPGFAFVRAWRICIDNDGAVIDILDDDLDLDGCDFVEISYLAATTAYDGETTPAVPVSVAVRSSATLFDGDDINEIKTNGARTSFLEHINLTEEGGGPDDMDTSTSKDNMMRVGDVIQLKISKFRYLGWRASSDFAHLDVKFFRSAT